MLERARRAAEPALRRLFHLYWRFARGMTLGVRAVVLNAGGEVFLVRHSYVQGWHLPGGGVEPGESAREALARELAEEGGIVGAEAQLRGVYFNDTATNRDHVVLFVIGACTRDPRWQPNHEIVEAGFFAPTALPAGTTGGTRRRLAEVFDGAPVSDRW